ncbi:MAG: ABC transporter substrate-binding protein [Clostridia bacterium]|nr:ABC transporter substrate-binding protein [Clostridia bacterium]
MRSKTFSALLLVLCLLLSGCVRSVEVQGAVDVPPFSIEIDGTAYRETDFADLTVYECKATSTNTYGSETTYLYTGYRLSDVLGKAGASTERGVTAVCTDGYEVDLDAKTAADATTLVAFWRDGEPFAEAGTVFVVPCKDKDSPDYAKAVSGLLTKAEGIGSRKGADLSAGTITVTDMLGQSVAVPADTKITTVAANFGVITPFLVSLKAGDRAVAVNFKNKQFYRILKDPIVNAGNIGTRVALDSEALAAIDPDVFICRTTDVGDMTITKKLDIPTVAITAEVPEEVLTAYELLGKVLGCEERAGEIDRYLRNELNCIDEMVKTIPEEKKVTALCLGSMLSRVASQDMLQTMLLKRVGARTVVDGIQGEKDRDWADIGVEKVFQMDPDYIFVTSSAVLDYSMDVFYKDASWSAMTAVKNRHIYQLPSKLDSWDMPGPGFILAMYYMMHEMYPEVCSAERLQTEIDDYYRFFFGRTFTGEEIGYEF